MDRVKLFEENMNLAYNEAHKRVAKLRRYEIKEDLIQAALMGLWVACMNFDESRGLAFSTYATLTCVGYMKSSNTHLDTRSERKIIERNNLKVNRISLSSPVKSGDDSITVEDTIKQSKCAKYDENDICFEIDFKNFTSRLTDREKQIIEYRKQELSQSEIGKKMGISQAQVSRHVISIGKKYEIWVNRGKNGES